MLKDGPAGATATAPVVADEPARSDPDRRERRLHRGWKAAVCLGFVVLALLQSPGRIVGDTKLDLAVDPLGFLGRALTMWDPEGFAGQLQNQAYGYFFPMGPFFALGDLVGLPAWVVQRLWLALLLCTAFLGVVVLARRLRIGTPGTAILAGVAYALAPRMVTALGATSVEVIPMALTPWVLVPLVGVAERHGSARRAAALSGLAVFCVGGVNAVATSAVLPLAVLYLATRPAGPLRRRLALWWVACVGLAVAWWAGLLVLLGRYSPRFFDYVETAAATTAPTDVLSALRGTSHWVAALSSPSGPLWPAGWSLLKDTLPVAGTIVLAVAGLVALTRRGLPERRWLVLGLLAGVGLVSLGHLATVDGLWAGALNEALDGPLSPLRNTHKFDPVLRLPLALGLAYLAAELVRVVRRPAGRRAWTAAASRASAAVVLVALAAGLVTTASPALAGRLTPPTGFEEIPDYWEQTADYLADQQPSGRALLVPASAFGTYAWGTTGDEPMQALADSPWEVRNIIPLTPESHIRFLDAVEQRFARADGSAGLTRYLARAGISHLVLRNDLERGSSGAVRPALVRETLRESPGIERVASFGPDVPDVDLPADQIYDGGLDEPTSAIEIYTVADPAPVAWTAPLADAVTLHGGPDGLLALEDRGLVTDRPVLMAGTSAVSTQWTVVSDALVRRERAFGRIDDATSAGLAPSDALRLGNPVRDYPIPALADAESVVAYVGGTPSASSSASDPAPFVGTRPEAQPWAAMDADLTTSWRPALDPERTRPDWWRVTTDRLFRASGVYVTLGAEVGERRPAELRLETDTGALTVPVQNTDEEQFLPIPEGYSGQLTIRALPPAGGGRVPPLVLAEVRVPGVTVERSVATPPSGMTADVYAFDAQQGRSGCVEATAGEPRCADVLASGTEETRTIDRLFATDVPTAYDVAATAAPRPGGALDELLTTVRGTVQAQASSTAVLDPRASALAAVDGDPATAWRAGWGDERPTLVLTWPEPRTIDSLRVVLADDLGASRPTAVSVSGVPGGSLPLDGDGIARFAPVVTDRLEVTFEQPEEIESVDPYRDETQSLNVGVSELEVGGPNPVVPPGTPVVLPCGEGPLVKVDGQQVPTALRSTVGALTALRPVPLEICDPDSVPVGLPAGNHRVVAFGTNVLMIDSVTLVRLDVPAPAAAAGRQAADVDRWDAEHRSVGVGARTEDTLLVVPENAIRGWTATLDGERLEAVTVDGWQQGYVLPAGPAGTVELEFEPGRDYRTALAAGAGAVLLLVVLAVVPGRPTRAHPARRSPAVATAARVLAALVLAGAVVVGTALVGGVVAVAATAALWIVGVLAGRWRWAVHGGVALGAAAAAGVLLLAAPEEMGTARQVLAVVALAAVVAGALPGAPGGSWRAALAGARRRREEVVQQ